MQDVKEKLGTGCGCMLGSECLINETLCSLCG